MKQLRDTIDYIEAHLGSKLTLEQLAQQAGFSPFHYARLFRLFCGCSIMSYVKRRKLAVAADRLIQTPSVSLLELALDCGFESQEAFTRAFKELFNRTPGQLRSRNDLSPHRYQLKIDGDFFQHIQQGVSMEPMIKEVQGIKAIGLGRVYTHDNNAGIPDLWREFVPRIQQIKHVKSNRTFGISRCSGPGVQGEFEYFASIEVDNLEQVPTGMTGIELKPALYAIFTHKIQQANLNLDLKNTLSYIWGAWLPSSKYKYSGAPDFELYDERFDPQAMTGEIDIYVPVLKK